MATFLPTVYNGCVSGTDTVSKTRCTSDPMNVMCLIDGFVVKASESSGRQQTSCTNIRMKGEKISVDANLNNVWIPPASIQAFSNGSNKPP